MLTTILMTALLAAGALAVVLMAWPTGRAEPLRIRVEEERKQPQRRQRHR
ncbi:hypothetical protein [Marinobacterium litorale]|jgi:hypothetical protein|nr:hypothetical protein [Marinobacterium litorale]